MGCQPSVLRPDLVSTFWSFSSSPLVLAGVVWIAVEYFVPR